MTSDYFARIKRMSLPKERIGMCRNAVKGKGNSKPCGSFHVVLGDGICMRCWDRSLAGMSWNQMKELRKDKEPKNDNKTST